MAAVAERFRPRRRPGAITCARYARPQAFGAARERAHRERNLQAQLAQGQARAGNRHCRHASRPDHLGAAPGLSRAESEILVQARRVTLATVLEGSSGKANCQKDMTQLVQQLAWNGVSAEAQIIAADGKQVTERLLNAADHA